MVGGEKGSGIAMGDSIAEERGLAQMDRVGK